MPTHSIHWTQIILGTSEFHAPTTRNRDESVVEWLNESATLYISMENREEICLEMDGEIFGVRV
jgi:hypothetical protein